jgi:tRNA(Ile)-lysidine synthase
MEEQFLNHIRASRLADPAQKILLAVSGGLDSMVMLHFFHRTGFKVGVAHVNFQLRGAESDGDEALVRDTCGRLGIPCFTTRFDTANYAETNKLSIQVAARELRYTWFRELMPREEYPLLATAHHLNDGLETVLLNLARGSSLKSIPARNGSIIRPLLPFSRQQLEAYAVQQQIRWRDDSSNATDDYSRNFIRHHVVPLLQQLNPALEEGFGRVMERLTATRELADRQVEALRQRYVSAAGNRITIDKAFAAELAQPVPLLWEFIRPIGFNYDQAGSIIAVLNGEPGRIFHTTAYTLVVDRTHLIITPRQLTPDPITIAEHHVQAQLGNRQLTITHHTGPWTVDRAPWTDTPQDPNVAWLDASQLAFPLTWRSWREGDFFYPLGMEQRKKVSDFLINRKVSVADKPMVTVFESGGYIVWVVGHRIDNRFKITAETRVVLRLEVGESTVHRPRSTAV